MRPQLIIIPGVGDDGPWAYRLFAWLWNRLGYDTHSVVFGWIDTASPLNPKVKTFLERLDQFEGPVNIIGISAGGTAAVNALLFRPQKVARIVTICSPLATMPNLRNPLLAESIARTEEGLLSLNPETKERILSVHALHDQVVDIRLSRPAGIRTYTIWTAQHAVNIFVAMTLGAYRLRHFFRTGK